MAKKLTPNPVHNPPIEAPTAKKRISGRGQHLKNTVAHLENRNIESAPAKVIDGNPLLLRLTKSVSQCSRRRLIDNAFDIQAGNFSCIFSGLTLRVVEVSRNGDNRVGYWLSQKI